MLCIKDGLDSMSRAELDSALALLPVWRREEALKYRFDKDRKLCVWSYLLLRDALKDNYGIGSFEVGREEGGKPFLIGHPDIQFNISHSGETAVCAIEGVPVGVDIEYFPENLDADLVNAIFSASEAAGIMSGACPAMEFALLWTRKESLLKCTGEGLCSSTEELKGLGSRFKDFIFESRVEKDRYVITECRKA